MTDGKKPEMPNDQPMQARTEELLQSAINHYKELSDKACSWHSSIPQALRWYFREKPKLEASLIAAQKELEKLKEEINTVMVMTAEQALALRGEPVVHPTYGTLADLVETVVKDQRNGYALRIGLEGALRWFASRPLYAVSGERVREACAKLCDKLAEDIDMERVPYINGEKAANRLAAEIRALPLAAIQGEQYDPRDWPEDFRLDSGKYSCRCAGCGKLFHGHKRRVTCKLCAAIQGDDWSREEYGVPLGGTEQGEQE